MDPFTTNRIAQALEKEVLKKAELEGYEVHVRKILRHYLTHEITKQSTESLAYGFGILVRANYMTENDVTVLFRHLGVLNE
jgi:hypothetical protein